MNLLRDQSDLQNTRRIDGVLRRSIEGSSGTFVLCI
jgi:hypothetical protein